METIPPIKVEFDEKSVPVSIEPLSPADVTPSVSEKNSLSNSSLQMVPAKKQEKFRTENKFKKWLLNLGNRFLIAIKMRPPPTENSPITRDAVYDYIDACLKDPDYFRRILLEASSVNEHYIPETDQTSLFFLLLR